MGETAADGWDTLGGWGGVGGGWEDGRWGAGRNGGRERDRNCKEMGGELVFQPVRLWYGKDKLGAGEGEPEEVGGRESLHK